MEQAKRTVFDLRTIEPRHQFDYFCEEVGRRHARFERKPLYAAKDFPALIRTFDYGSSHGTLVDNPLLSGRRTKDHIRSDNRQDHFLKLVVSGAVKMRFGDRVSLIDAGKCYLANYGKPQSFETTGVGDFLSILTLRLPSENFQGVTSQDDHHFEKRFLHHKLAPLFKMSLIQLVASMQGADDQETSKLIGIIESLVTLMANDRTIRSFPADKGLAFEMLDAEISGRLSDTGLSVRSIAHQFGTSVRYIQRLMAGRQTSFSNFLREKRLMLVMSRLQDKAYARESIENIVYACGFNELSAFYRAFKKMFHCTPGDARRDAPLLGNTPGRISTH